MWPTISNDVEADLLYGIIYWFMLMKQNNFLPLFSHMDSVSMKRMNTNFQSLVPYEMFMQQEGGNSFCVCVCSTTDRSHQWGEFFCLFEKSAAQ